MIVASAPMRVSLAGGGSDLPIFQNTGQTGYILSFAIPFRIYVTILERKQKGLVIQYSEIERPESIDSIKHPLIRAGLRYFGINELNLEIHSISSITTQGVGIGGSSAFMCALTAVLDWHKKRKVAGLYTLNKAIEIEIGLAGAPIGIQDFVPAIFGGINFMTIKHGKLIDHKRWYAGDLRGLIEKHLILVAHDEPGRDRYIDQNKPGDIDTSALAESAKLAEISQKLISKSHLVDLVKLINTTHELKEKNSINRSTEEQLKFIGILKKAGALALKRCGAGREGYYLVCVKSKDAFASRLPNNTILPLSVESRGTTVQEL